MYCVVFSKRSGKKKHCEVIMPSGCSAVWSGGKAVESSCSFARMPLGTKGNSRSTLPANDQWEWHGARLYSAIKMLSVVAWPQGRGAKPNFCHNHSVSQLTPAASAARIQACCEVNGFVDDDTRLQLSSRLNTQKSCGIRQKFLMMETKSSKRQQKMPCALQQ